MSCTPWVQVLGRTMDAGNLLKPMLARGEVYCIRRSFELEYRQHIEKDAALERVFRFLVNQPTVEMRTLRF
jgi:ATP-dependent Clp protease ATP-binding subunit ClpB